MAATWSFNSQTLNISIGIDSEGTWATVSDPSSGLIKIQDCITTPDDKVKFFDKLVALIKPEVKVP